MAVRQSVIPSETVERGRGPERPPNRACDNTSNAVICIAVYQQNSRNECCNNERNNDLAP
jgi:hypothetical protein